MLRTSDRRKPDASHTHDATASDFGRTSSRGVDLLLNSIQASDLFEKDDVNLMPTRHKGEAEGGLRRQQLAIGP